MRPENITDIIVLVTNLAKTAVPILVALSLLYFFWGISSFILKSGEKDARKEGKERMVWGLVALFVIVSVAGLLTIVQNTLFPSLHTLPSNSVPPGTLSNPLDGPSTGQGIRLPSDVHITPDDPTNVLNASREEFQPRGTRGGLFGGIFTGGACFFGFGPDCRRR